MAKFHGFLLVNGVRLALSWTLLNSQLLGPKEIRATTLMGGVCVCFF